MTTKQMEAQELRTFIAKRFYGSAVRLSAGQHCGNMIQFWCGCARYWYDACMYLGKYSPETESLCFCRKHNPFIREIETRDGAVYSFSM